MPKRLVLCSDGTGNQGGWGQDSNVYRMYKAVDTSQGDQVIFYDNGVGTQSNRIFRALAGAFGFGFEGNVRDLYEFLVRNYEDGDEIYLFGFSRGAATVRSFASLVHICGLVRKLDDNGNWLSTDQIQSGLDEAIRCYRQHETNPQAAANFKRTNAMEVPIHFLGVWDTVSALGFPKDWSLLFKYFFEGVDILSDALFPHRYHSMKLPPNVRTACHAVAIDDERRTFAPIMLDEHDDRPDQHVEQVWFPGVHSNVGGGYRRTGLSDLALDWMMERATAAGLRVSASRRADVKHRTNIHGKLYNSRDGLGVYYRYGPRDIAALCRAANAPILIHRAAIERMERHTSGYAPGHLPDAFTVVANDMTQREDVTISANDSKPIRERIAAAVNKREWLYRTNVELSLAALIAAGYLWNLNPTYVVGTAWWQTLLGHLRDVSHYLAPKYFEPLFSYLFVHRPAALLVFLVIVGILWFLMNTFRHETQVANERLRDLCLRSWSRASADETP